MRCIINLSMSVSLLSTKLYTPPTRADGVSRPHLTDKLQSCLSQPGCFALLSGPAGFGKTTLLSEFVTDLKHPVAWVSLDEGDDDPIRFWSYVISACQSVHAGLGESALEILRSPLPQSGEAVTTSMINDLAGLDQDLILVLDDYHNIQNEAIHSAFTYLLEHSPSNFHVVISTRIDPPWPLARFRVRNKLIEVRAQNLRFTTEEATSFLNRMMGLNLSPMDISALEERTEGWVAGLQLAALSMKGRNDIAGFIKAFTGSHIYIAEYLVEEVLKRQPEYAQTFLLRSSILDRLNAPLCEAVTGCENGHSMLLDLHKANLFVTQMDDEGEWFRYHHLFRDLLKARLHQNISEDAISSLNQRAAAWFERMDMIPEAIEHSLSAGDYPHVVKMVEKVGLSLILQAYVRTVERWLRSIPPKYLENSPRLNMAFAWMNLVRGTIPQAMLYLDRLETLFSSQKMNNQDPSLLGEWLALRSHLLNLQGKPDDARDLANQALQILPEADSQVRSMAFINLATAYQQTLDYDHAGETFQLIVKNAQATGDHTFETLGISGHARMLLMEGKLHRGFEVASEGIKLMEASGKRTPFSATIYGELGQIYYHWHQLEMERKYTLLSMQMSGKNGYSDPEIFNYITMSKTCQMEGDWEGTANEMHKAEELMRLIPPAMIRENIISQQIRVFLAFGQLKEAQEIFKDYGFFFDGNFRYPELTPDALISHTTGLLYNSAFRVILAQARINKDQSNLQLGIDVAAHLIDREIACHNITAALESLLVRSQMNAALGDEQKRLLDVTRALEIAEPEGFISVFVEEGKAVAEALILMVERGLNGNVQPAFIQEVLSAFPKTLSTHGIQHTKIHAYTSDQKHETVDQTVLVEPLTEREMDVLLLISAGDSNQAIADKLFISISAVKKHTSNILGKLNVNSRTHAVARARQLKLLPIDE